MPPLPIGLRGDRDLLIALVLYSVGACLLLAALAHLCLQLLAAAATPPRRSEIAES